MHNLSLALGCKALKGAELRFAIGMVGRHKANPAFTPSAKAVRWMTEIVGRFQREMLREEDGERDEVTR